MLILILGGQAHTVAAGALCGSSGSSKDCDGTAVCNCQCPVEPIKKPIKGSYVYQRRSTGIPTIQNVLKASGSPRAIVVTGDERTFFRITIPCHEAAGNIIADIASKDKRDTIDGPKDTPKELTDRQKLIIEMIVADPFLSAKAISEKISERMPEKDGTNERTIERDLAKLKKLGILTREGGRKEGKWIIMPESRE